MTCIVGIEHEGSVWIGGDSCASSGSDIRIRNDPKVFVRDGFIIGFTASFRMGQILMFDWAPPKRKSKHTDGFRFMVKHVVPSIRTCLRDGGYTLTENGREEGGNFLIGHRGQLFEIDSDFQVAMPMDGFAAVGSGAHYALGALLGRKKSKKTVACALRAAACFNGAVKGPFIIERLDT